MTSPFDPERLHHEAESLLRAYADARKAAEMAAYMKTGQPFFGVQKTQRKNLFKELRSHIPQTQADYSAGIRSLWRGPQRELQYLALDFAHHHHHFITMEALSLFEAMIREGAWWDFVDDIAANLVGPILLRHRPTLKPIMERWVVDKDLWIRRSAILVHLKHKANTDEEQLFAHCLRLAPEREFFIRKAIGWALREYGKTAPASVTAFLNMNHNQLSGLSYREGSRRLGMNKSMASEQGNP